MTVEYLMVVYRRIIDLLETFSVAKPINRLTFGLKIWHFVTMRAIFIIPLR